ncbi:L-aminoadipate-semialdehyde dehydrogenase [Fomitopsis serialis]|uniref:L-aminoadipate-semialdehyde dehydrogenase n=1 Tax=Fomitopsis serialis TaxID=139415 RepID=UPI002007CC90|nr:L-aminoadipate-semialdehyde dehydrogenase [Neoantrodia serialis]KAH9923666.1 L-aminoadipate-semialdehyde dehydrogenase [Neoantrodia serialis]
MPAPTYIASSLTELVAIRARVQPNDVAIYTGIDEPGPLLRALTYSQVQRADGIPPERVIAVLTSSAVDESLLEIALAKLGLASLLLSVNNSVPAIAHLCKITQSTHLIYGSKHALSHLGPGGVDDVKIEPFPAVLKPQDEKKRTCVILHSSGSTGFPKPVYISHSSMIANVAGFVSKPGFSALPVYHGFGHYSVFRCYYPGVPFVLYPAHLPLTSANLCKVINAIPIPCPLGFAVPYVIKLLGETEEGTRAMAKFESVTYAGAAVPDDLGDRLTAAGVNLKAIFGSTETGSFLSSDRNFADDKAWNWLRVEGRIADYLLMEDRGSDTYESVVLDGWPAKNQSNRPDGSYATKDLFVKHAEHPNWYKYIGRLDDTLVQVLGEKTNPVPIELAIQGNSPYVEQCIVFGAGRPQIGCLLLPSDFAKGLYKDRDAYMEKVWPVIEDANAQAPTHSRILPEMVYILEYGTPIPQATKLSILRPAYGVYDRFENGSSANKIDLSQSELEDFIFNATTQTEAHQDIDLFAFGVDSLQATRIRNICQKELELNEQTLGQNVVYENPSVEKLAAFITALRSGAGRDKSVAEDHAAMWTMVDKWASKFVQWEAPEQTSQRMNSASQLSCVLTGATGSLGAHILHQLVSFPSVERVVCLSRAKTNEDSVTRLQESLKSRRLQLSGEQWKKVESFAADVNEDHLGLSSGAYEHIVSQATAVIHNAWPVNFNMNLDSYDAHIGGVLNLINLCLRSPKTQSPSFYFSSSIAAVTGSTDPVCNEDFPTSAATALPTGYGRSKWVVEKLSEKAARATPLHVGILRIGQVVGDTKSGVWNETESWPLMFKATESTRALPTFQQNPQWLPVNIAGRAIAEIATRFEPPKAAVYHIVNPTVTSGWDTIIAGLKKAGIEFDVVSRSEWLDRLAKSDPDGERNPAIKLLPYYRTRFGKPTESIPMQFRVDTTCSIAPTLATSPAISQDLVEKWVQHWREVGFLGQS